MKVPPPPDPSDPARAADAAFYRSLVDLAERTAPQGARSPRRRRRRRGRAVRLAAVVLPVLGLGATVATGVFLVDDGSVKIEKDPGKRIAPSPADRRIGAARAKDPVNSTVWGVRLYYNKRGESCALTGPVIDGRLGRLQNGKFKSLPDGAPGVCHNMRDHIFTTSRTYNDTPEPRTILYGVVDRSIIALQLRTHDGQRHNIPIAPDGSYVLALSGPQPLTGATLTTQTPTQTTTRKLKTHAPPPTLNP